MRPFDLTGRVVILTGSAGHLGRAMSRAILAAGAELIMVGRTEATLIGERAKVPPEQRARCHAVACDITREGFAQLLYDQVGERFGRLHGIVNNAYSGRVGSIDAIERRDVLEACTYNLVAPLELVKAFAPLLQRSARQDQVTSSVVNIASMYGSVSPDPAVYGDTGRNNPVSYGVSKAGMIQLSRYLACHLGSTGIRVNCVSPGPFPNLEIDSGIPGLREQLARRVPMQRVGKPEEIAGPVVFLLSDASSYVNGANLAVDGGWTAW